MDFPSLPVAGNPLVLLADAEMVCAGLDLSPKPLLLCRPVFGPNDQLLDFALDYLNAAAQRQLALPARPGGTVRTHLPEAQAAGMVAFCQRVFEAGMAGQAQANTAAEGSETYGPLAARRSGAQLVVSLPDAEAEGHRATQEALRASQAGEADALAEALRQRLRLLAVFEEAPGLIARLSGPDHVIELANDAFRQAFGGRELVGRPYREAAPELADQSFFDWLDTVYRTGETYHGQEVRAELDRTNTGQLEPSYYNFTYQATRDAAGAVAGVLVFAYDVSEQVRARQQLEQLNQELETRVAERTRTAVAAQAEVLAAARRQVQAREAFYQVFEQTPALIALLREPNHRIEYCNPAFERLFPGPDLVGRLLNEVAPELVASGFIGRLDHVYSQGSTGVDYAVPFVGAAPGNGAPQTAYFTFTYQAYKESGRTAGVSVFAYDVTAQVLARQAREQQQQQLEDLFMQAPAPIVILDGPDLVFQLVNPAYQQIFPGRELVGKPLLEALPELVGTVIPDLFAQVYDTGEPYVAQEMPLMMARHENGPLEEIYWTFSYQARRDEHGAVDGVRVFANEVTEPVRARQLALANARQAQELAQELTAANQQLSRANADLDAFAYTAAHDLRGPVDNLDGLLVALQEQLPPAVRTNPDVRPLLDLIQGALARFSRTLDQLTDVIREQAAPEQPAEVVDLAALVEDVRLDLGPLLSTGTPQLLVDVAGCPRLTFAPRNLRSIVYNLLSNALKYRDPAREPEVNVRCRTLGAIIVLEVADNGLGLSASQQGRLFGLFERMHTHVEGSGLGLYTVKKIVENAGGTIAVQSQPGVGTTFTITLPGSDPIQP
ncbi:PAS domain-containing protein [Hymenobacter lapidiphilus]|uniref:PAS domain-containing sensor histidine kinase n=1 Tax=Hymenobacter sp. CCM 8763 TaxID=2303334 RepID=UPI000E346F3B|nr:PAS domain-containing protein [Hymenobacter sp. CCM 8763]RFP65705.1 PAS domain-containing protein [Hymenobacter sp. CCM 8763]